jgi:hypothetical protein
MLVTINIFHTYLPDIKTAWYLPLLPVRILSFRDFNDGKTSNAGNSVKQHTQYKYDSQYPDGKILL